MSEPIIIDEKEVYIKRYKLRPTSKNGKGSIETTIPPDVLEKEARKRGVSVPELCDCMEAEWRYNSFRGIHMILVEKAEKKGESNPVALHDLEGKEA